MLLDDRALAALEEICPLQLPAAALPWVVTPADAADLRLSRRTVARRVSQGRWQRALPGVYFTFSGSPTEDQRLTAALRYAGPRAVLSGQSALRRYGLRQFAEPSRVLVLVPHGRRVRSTGAVAVRQTRRLPDPAEQADGFPVSGIARATIDAVIGETDLSTVRAVIAAPVQRRLCTVESLHLELRAAPVRGSALARRALSEVAGGARSAPECAALTLFRRARLPAFEANADVYDDQGGWLACADYLWKELRAVSELESREWHLDPSSWERTLRRYRRLAEHGYSVLPLPPSALTRDPAGTVRQVRSWLRRRAAELGVPYRPAGG